MSRILNLASSFASSVARLGYGSRVKSLGKRPEKPLEIYEFESCPFCRKAREALCMLDLDAMVYPCPKGGPRYRKEVIERGGKAQFPYLVDPNTDTEMYESNAIVRYLFQQYGTGRVPVLLKAGPHNDITSSLASVARPIPSGRIYKNAKAPKLPLELYNFEASPFCRIVRETLCSLEIPYLVRNVAKGSEKRAAFKERAGKVMVPYLVDPNTDTEMFESTDIVRYLRKTYAR